MLELLWKYLVGPIVADAKGVETLAWKGATTATGYNPVNTVFYAATAGLTLYLIYRFFQTRDVELTPQTAITATPFILLGGTLRFLDDAQLVPYPYSIPLITPLIYFLIAAIFVPAIIKLDEKKVKILGTAILTPVLIYSLINFQSFNLIYASGTIALSLLITAIYYLIFEEEFVKPYLIVLVFTQVFEGVVSMFSSFYGYQPKQLLAQTFNTFLGFPGVLVMKLGILALAISVIRDIEDSKLKSIALITLYSVGLGTGFRVFLRVTAGV